MNVSLKLSLYVCKMYFVSIYFDSLLISIHITFHFPSMNASKKPDEQITFHLFKVSFSQRNFIFYSKFPATRHTRHMYNRPRAVYSSMYFLPRFIPLLCLKNVIVVQFSCLSTFPILYFFEICKCRIVQTKLTFRYVHVMYICLEFFSS